MADCRRLTFRGILHTVAMKQRSTCQTSRSEPGSVQARRHGGREGRCGADNLLEEGPRRF